MAEGRNRIQVIGYVTADPQLRLPGSGQAVLKLRIATSERFLDRSGARQERTEFHSVAIWGKRGEALARVVKRGTRMLAEGSVRHSTYVQPCPKCGCGVKRYGSEIVAQDVMLFARAGADVDVAASADAATVAEGDAPPPGDDGPIDPPF